LRIETGVDAVEIRRIAKSIQRPGFLRRFFSEEEQAYFESRKTAPQTVAGHFAAKEAFSKAMGTGLAGFELREVTVRHDERRKPFLVMEGQAAALAAGWSFSLSITHTEDTATAFVVAWQDREEEPPCAL